MSLASDSSSSPSLLAMLCDVLPFGPLLVYVLLLSLVVPASPIRWRLHYSSCCALMNGLLAFHYTLGVPVLLHKSKPRCLSTTPSVLEFPLPPRLYLHQWPLVIPSPASSMTLWTLHFSWHQHHCHPGDSYTSPSLPASLRRSLAHLRSTVSVCLPEDFPEDFSVIKQDWLFCPS